MCGINVGNKDATLRVVLSMALSLLAAFVVKTGTLAMVLLAASAVLLATAALGFCGLYTVLRINTCETPKKKK